MHGGHRLRPRASGALWSLASYLPPKPQAFTEKVAQIERTGRPSAAADRPRSFRGQTVFTRDERTAGVKPFSAPSPSGERAALQPRPGAAGDEGSQEDRARHRPAGCGRTARPTRACAVPERCSGSRTNRGASIAAGATAVTGSTRPSRPT